MGTQSNVLIYDDPFHSPLEVVNGVVFAVTHEPRPLAVRLLISPNLQVYREHFKAGELEVRQYIVWLLEHGVTQVLHWEFDGWEHPPIEMQIEGKRWTVSPHIGHHCVDPKTGNDATQAAGGQWFNHYGFDFEWED